MVSNSRKVQRARPFGGLEHARAISLAAFSPSKIGGTAVYESSDLFRGASEIGIEHDGAIYRLKITRQGKLILNK